MKSSYWQVCLFILCVCFLSSCSGMFDSLREESLAADEEAQQQAKRDVASTDNYKSRVVKGASANNLIEYDPGVKRKYDYKNEVEHKISKDDFVDKDFRENSLWDAQGQGNYLFAHNPKREAGDLVTVSIEKMLKQEIQYQLWLTLPPEQRHKKRKLASTSGVASLAGQALAKNTGGDKLADKAAQKTAEAGDRAAADEAAKTDLKNGSSEDDDVVRMEVVEDLGSGLVRMTGQKRVIYRGKAKIIEVASMIRDRDIDDNSHSKSSKFLDTRVQVLQ